MLSTGSIIARRWIALALPPPRERKITIVCKMWWVGSELKRRGVTWYYFPGWLYNILACVSPFTINSLTSLLCHSIYGYTIARLDNTVSAQVTEIQQEWQYGGQNLTHTVNVHPETKSIRPRYPHDHRWMRFRRRARYSLVRYLGKITNQHNGLQEILRRENELTPMCAISLSRTTSVLSFADGVIKR